MHRLLATTALIALLPIGSALAGTPAPNPTSGMSFMLGIAVEFGDESPDVGITGKILAPVSNQFVVGGGVSYFLTSPDQPLGLDLSAGLNLGSVAVLGGYDFLRQQPQVSAGLATGGTPTCPSPYVYFNGVCTIPASDRRLKRDVVHVATLADGIRLYAFRYLWSDTVYVGAMAQDLLEDPRWSHAVLTGDDGFYRVDYDRLDLRMVTIDEWNEAGVEAVVLGSRPAELQIAQAA
jgi:hypothetical protein